MSLNPEKVFGLDRLSGEALKIKITEYLANKGMESYPAINTNKKFPPNLIKTRERIAMEIHKM